MPFIIYNLLQTIFLGEVIMNNNYWQQFLSTGKIEYYLNYVNTEKNNEIQDRWLDFKTNSSGRK